MTIKAPFYPSYTNGQTVTPAAAAASITLAKGTKQICLTNLGANVCYVRMGMVAADATTADYPIPAGWQVSITKNEDDTVLSHISAAGTTLHIIPGEGF